ncbi:hypothetical protein L345_01924, partial [Ophiophagus hannah]
MPDTASQGGSPSSLRLLFKALASVPLAPLPPRVNFLMAVCR